MLYNCACFNSSRPLWTPLGRPSPGITGTSSPRSFGAKWDGRTVRTVGTVGTVPSHFPESIARREVHSSRVKQGSKQRHLESKLSSRKIVVKSDNLSVLRCLSRWRFGPRLHATNLKPPVRIDWHGSVLGSLFVVASKFGRCHCLSMLACLFCCNMLMWKYQPECLSVVFAWFEGEVTTTAG